MVAQFPRQGFVFLTPVRLLFPRDLGATCAVPGLSRQFESGAGRCARQRPCPPGLVRGPRSCLRVTFMKALSENAADRRLPRLHQAFADDARDARRHRLASGDARGLGAELQWRHQYIALADAGVERFALLPGGTPSSRASTPGSGSHPRARRHFNSRHPPRPSFRAPSSSLSMPACAAVS